MTVLAHHAPLLTTLSPGLLDIGSPGGERQRYFVRGGFAEVGPAGLTVLAETAIDLVELDADQLAQAIKDAEEDVADAARNERPRPRPDQARPSPPSAGHAQPLALRSLGAEHEVLEFPDHALIDLALERHDERSASSSSGTHCQASNSCSWPALRPRSISLSSPSKPAANHSCFWPR